MSFPLGAPRGKAWDAARQPAVRRSVTVAGPEAFEASYERGEQSPAKALEAVVDHSRAMTRLGAWPALARYRLAIAGTDHRREVDLTGPKRGDA